MLERRKVLWVGVEDVSVCLNLNNPAWDEL